MLSDDPSPRIGPQLPWPPVERPPNKPRRSVMSRILWRSVAFGAAAAITAIIGNWSWQVFTDLFDDAALKVTIDLDNTPFVPSIPNENAIGHVEFRPIYLVTNTSDEPYIIETISFHSKEPSTFWSSESGKGAVLCSRLRPAILTSRGLNDEGRYDPVVLAPIPLVIGPDETRVIIPDFYLGLSDDCRKGPSFAGAVRLRREIIVADITPSMLGRRVRRDHQVPYSCEDMTDYDLVFHLTNGKRESIRMKHFITTEKDAWDSRDHLIVCSGQTNVPGDVMDRLLSEQAVQRERQERANASPRVETRRPATK